MSQPSGYESYSFVTELYDYVIPYRDHPDVDFYVEAALQARGPVLEIGCGTGWVLILDLFNPCFPDEIPVPFTLVDLAADSVRRRPG
jgi:hypothetical protein